MDESTRDFKKVFINPEITVLDEELQEYDEGCLSIPDVYGDVERPVRVIVRALDRDGQTFEMEASELLARWTQYGALTPFFRNHTMTGSIDQYAWAFGEAIDTDPRTTPAYLHLGDLRAAQHDLPGAVQAWLAMVKTTPERAYLAFDRLERAFATLGPPGRFAALCRELIHADPQDWRARLALARHLAAGAQPAADPRVAREEYLRTIDGMVYVMGLGTSGIDVIDPVAGASVADVVTQVDTYLAGEDFKAQLAKDIEATGGILVRLSGCFQKFL